HTDVRRRLVVANPRRLASTSVRRHGARHRGGSWVGRAALPGTCASPWLALGSSRWPVFAGPPPWPMSGGASIGPGSVGRLPAPREGAAAGGGNRRTSIRSSLSPYSVLRG